MSVILLDALYLDPGYIAAQPMARFLYVMLCLQMPLNRKINFAKTLKNTGFSKEEGRALYKELRELGLVKQEGKVVSLPHLATHLFHARGVVNLSDEEKKQVQDVFEFWQQTMGKEKARMTPKRRDKIRMRLRENFSVDDLKDAIRGCFESEWHMGDNPGQKMFNDLELIFRHPEKVEKFMEQHRHNKQQQEPIPEQDHNRQKRLQRFREPEAPDEFEPNL